MKQYTKSEVLKQLRDYFISINVAEQDEPVDACGLTSSQIRFIGHAASALSDNTIRLTVLNARTGRSFPKTVNA